MYCTAHMSQRTLREIKNKNPLQHNVLICVIYAFEDNILNRTFSQNVTCTSKSTTRSSALRVHVSRVVNIKRLTNEVPRKCKFTRPPGQCPPALMQLHIVKLFSVCIHLGTHYYIIHQFWELFNSINGREFCLFFLILSNRYCFCNRYLIIFHFYKKFNLFSNSLQLWII